MHRPSFALRSTCALALLALLSVALPVEAQVDARMLRYPDVSATHISFVYAGDIWIVPKEGGIARRLSTPAGEEQFPRFSPDGQHIAYSANYDGNIDVYVVPAFGGQVQRVTHHPMPDRMLDWVPDSASDAPSILYASGMKSEKNRFSKLFTVPMAGGLPEQLPVPYGAFGAISPDGETLAYMPISRDFRTWKRYRGGSTTDVWIFDLEDFSKQLQTIMKMGSLKDLLGLIPGVGAKFKQLNVDESIFRKYQAIIGSMTGHERSRPDLIDMSRRRRIANGSGTSTHEVQTLLKQFQTMKKMMGKFGDIQEMAGKLPDQEDLTPEQLANPQAFMPNPNRLFSERVDKKKEKAAKKAKKKKRKMAKKSKR